MTVKITWLCWQVTMFILVGVFECLNDLRGLLGNHIFAVVFLWVVFCLYLASTLFAWKMFKEFQKKYWKPGTADDRPSMIPADSWRKPDP